MGRSMDSFIVISLIKVVVVFAVLMTTLAYLQWVERKVIAHIQVRPGPYRVGPHGLLQPLADVIKLITKEDLMPPYVQQAALPAGAVPGHHHGAAFDLGDSVRPDHHGGRLPHLDAAHRSEHRRAVRAGGFVMGVYGIALAGWASNNKYALLGGLRSSAQMISYELPLSLAIAAPLLLSNTLSLRELVDTQAGGIWHWNMLHVPVPADHQLHHFSDRGVRGNQPRAVRPAGSGKRAGGRLPHRVQQHEVRLVLHGRIRQHDHRELHGDAAVSGRLGGAVAGAIRLELGAGRDFRAGRRGGAVSRHAIPARRRDRLHAAGGRA